MHYFILHSSIPRFNCVHELEEVGGTSNLGTYEHIVSIVKTYTCKCVPSGTSALLLHVFYLLAVQPEMSDKGAALMPDGSVSFCFASVCSWLVL